MLSFIQTTNPKTFTQIRAELAENFALNTSGEEITLDAPNAENFDVCHLARIHASEVYAETMVNLFE